MNNHFETLLMLLAILMFLVGVVQLILALIFTIRRVANKTGWRGWLYYWIGVGIYFTVMIGIFIFLRNEREQLTEQYLNTIDFENAASLPYNDVAYEQRAARIEVLETFLMAWFFTANILAIYFFFAGKISDRIFQKQNQFINQH
jgi:hypothetical protein